MFTLLKERYLKERENKKQKNRFYIENGFYQSSSDEYKIASNEGLKRYSTETRYNQYKNGVITREKAVDYAAARMEKQIDKEIAATLEKLEKIEKAPDLQYISINVSYTKTGYASSWGHDKESSAVASAFNDNYSILKVLYTIKENALKAGLSDASKTACTGIDNRTVCGYGAGYSIFPYFEGGVGVGCFWDILKKAGFTTHCNYGKHENYYNVSRIGSNK